MTQEGIRFSQEVSAALVSSGVLERLYVRRHR